MKRYPFTVPLLVLVSTCACSSDEATNTDAASTISSGSTSTPPAPATSASRAPASSRPLSPRSSAASASSSGPAARGARSAESTAAATGQPPSARPSAPTFTCHYEEGDALCNASEYAINKTAWPAYQAQNNGGKTPSTSSTQTGDIARDANGFALGGPPRPTLAEHPTKTQCTTYRDALVAWSNYQNQRRPAGSMNLLPMSGEVQNLALSCDLTYPSTP